MQLVQSFWTKPAINDLFSIKNRIYKDLYIIALSCIYAKNSGAKLDMYTDDIGIQLLDYLPYNNLYNTLNDINVHHNAFAYPKFVVMKNLPLGYIHIDNDVFIKSERCLNAMEFDDYDCIVQSKEMWINQNYKYHKMVEETYSEELAQFGFHDVIKHKYEYNCGIVGFNNQELKTKYFDTYFGLIDISQNKIPTMYPDILFEQQVLIQMTKNYKVKLLINKDRSANYIGYQHVLSDNKWKRFYLIKKLLSYYSPDIYRKTEEKIKYFKDNKII